MPLPTFASEIGRSIKIQKGVAEKKPLLRDGKLKVTIRRLIPLLLLPLLIRADCRNTRDIITIHYWRLDTQNALTATYVFLIKLCSWESRAGMHSHNQNRLLDCMALYPVAVSNCAHKTKLADLDLIHHHTHLSLFRYIFRGCKNHQGRRKSECEEAQQTFSQWCYLGMTCMVVAIVVIVRLPN